MEREKLGNKNTDLEARVKVKGKDYIPVYGVFRHAYRTGKGLMENPRKYKENFWPMIGEAGFLLLYNTALVGGAVYGLSKLI